MTRLALGTLLTGLMAGTWGGCEREPVTPPATPPLERAPAFSEGDDARGLGGIILLDDTRRRG